jgi:hypothetical protein
LLEAEAEKLGMDIKPKSALGEGSRSVVPLDQEGTGLVQQREGVCLDIEANQNDADALGNPAQRVPSPSASSLSRQDRPPDPRDPRLPLPPRPVKAHTGFEPVFLLMALMAVIQQEYDTVLDK